MKREWICLVACLAFLPVVSPAQQAKPQPRFHIDSDFPGGNIRVDLISGDVINLRPDIRDSNPKSVTSYRLWAFRVRGAQQRTLNFQFSSFLKGKQPDPFGSLSTRGPAISRDGGKTWRWMLDGKAVNPPFAFSYRFGPEEREVLFSWMPPFTGSTLRQFVSSLGVRAARLRIESLCKTPRGRDAELLRFGNDAAEYRVILTARHHTNEVWGSVVLCGLVDEALSDASHGRYLREHASFFAVPMVDRDGCEDGDQGKDRLPHDHNRDYDKGAFATVRAIKAQTAAWAAGKKVVSKGFSDDNNAGKSRWWMAHSLNAIMAVTCESPFARPEGEPNTAEDALAFGRFMARALAQTMQDYQAGRVPIAVGNGRIYVSAEEQYAKPKGWCHQYSLVVSAPAASDLLDAANWTKSSRVLIPPEMANLAHLGWLEGNMVQRRADGKIFNILRTHGVTDEVAAFYEVAPDGKTAILNTYDMFLRMPGAAKKFYIFPDDRSDTYYVLSNWILEKDRGKVRNCPHPIKAERTRNTLALARSDNLMDWEVISVILHDDDIDHCGFQYPTAAIEGDDLLILSRTAFGSGAERAENQHNSNFITFHRVRDFRRRTLKTEPLTGKIE